VSKRVEEDDWYFKATRDNLLRALSDSSQVQVMLDLIAPIEAKRVLDVGCGIGQALFPLAINKGAHGIGIDISEVALSMGREFYATHLPHANVAFVHGKAESLPFAANSFDVINCGLALPYMDNTRVIAEVARVLRPGGMFLLKIHHARYYLRELRRGLVSRDVSSVIYAGRVLVAGMIYHLTGRQPRVRFLDESFQTRWLLRRELARHGLVIDREQANSNLLTPAFVIYSHS
jgi:SAM-dependent methyltransferase